MDIGPETITNQIAIYLCAINTGNLCSAITSFTKLLRISCEIAERPNAPDTIKALSRLFIQVLKYFSGLISSFINVRSLKCLDTSSSIFTC